mgnify:CR=1 FL=1
MTDILALTVKKALNDQLPGQGFDALRRAQLGTLLASLATSVAETHAVGATFKCILDRLPLQGSILATRVTGSFLAQREVHPSCTLAASQFKVDYTTGEVTFETTDFNDTDEAAFVYKPVDDLAAVLAETLELS